MNIVYCLWEKHKLLYKQCYSSLKRYNRSHWSLWRFIAKRSPLLPLPPGILWQKLLFLLSCTAIQKILVPLIIIPLLAFGNKVFPLVNYAVIFSSSFFSRTRKSAYLGRMWEIKRIGQQSRIYRRVETVWRWNIRPTFLVIKRRRTTSINERSSSS